MEYLLSGISNNSLRMFLTLVFIVISAVMTKGIVLEIIPELVSSVKEKNKSAIGYYSGIFLVAVTCVYIGVSSINILLVVDSNNQTILKGV